MEPLIPCLCYDFSSHPKWGFSIFVALFPTSASASKLHWNRTMMSIKLSFQVCLCWKLCIEGKKVMTVKKTEAFWDFTSSWLPLKLCWYFYFWIWSSVFYISLLSDIKYNNLNLDSIAWADKLIRMSHGCTSTNSSNSTVMHQVQTDYLLIFMHANIAKWWRRLRGACVKDDPTPARVRRPPEPRCTCRHGYPQYSICGTTVSRGSRSSTFN